MIEKLFNRPLEKAIGLYILLVIGNVTTGIMNDAIDNVLPELDSSSAGILTSFRFIINIPGAIIVTIGGFIIWYIAQMNKN